MRNRFLQLLLSRTTIVNATFLAGIAWMSFGAERVGQSFEIDGLGSLVGGVALIVFAYLLGAE